MWIVRLALRRPYTFVVMAMLIAILGIVMILRMPTDIFPTVDIPVVSIIFNYGGMPADDRSAEHHADQNPERARQISEAEARQKLASLYFASVGAAQVRNVSKLFGWAPELVRRTVEKLVQKGEFVVSDHAPEYARRKAHRGAPAPFHTLPHRLAEIEDDAGPSSLVCECELVTREQIEAEIRAAVPFSHLTTHLEPIEDPRSLSDQVLERSGSMNEQRKES